MELQMGCLHVVVHLAVYKLVYTFKCIFASITPYLGISCQSVRVQAKTTY